MKMKMLATLYKVKPGTETIRGLNLSAVMFKCLDCSGSVSCTERGLGEAVYILYIHP
jgi:uncharacterized sporulation protein YeaH/YhbH (DUF444 family)